MKMGGLIHICYTSGLHGNTVKPLDDNPHNPNCITFHTTVLKTNLLSMLNALTFQVPLQSGFQAQISRPDALIIPNNSWML